MILLGIGSSCASVWCGWSLEAPVERVYFFEWAGVQVVAEMLGPISETVRLWVSEALAWVFAAAVDR